MCMQAHWLVRMTNSRKKLPLVVSFLFVVSKHGGIESAFGTGAPGRRASRPPANTVRAGRRRRSRRDEVIADATRTPRNSHLQRSSHLQFARPSLPLRCRLLIVIARPAKQKKFKQMQAANFSSIETAAIEPASYAARGGGSGHSPRYTCIRDTEPIWSVPIHIGIL